MITIGTGIKVSHCMGAGQGEQAKSYVKTDLSCLLLVLSLMVDSEKEIMLQ